MLPPRWVFGQCAGCGAGHPNSHYILLYLQLVQNMVQQEQRIEELVRGGQIEEFNMTWTGGNQGDRF